MERKHWQEVFESPHAQPLVHVHDMRERVRYRREDAQGQRQEEPVRRRWICEEYVMDTRIVERRQWEGLDMAVGKVFVHLCARSPFMAGVMFMGVVMLTGYLTLSIIFGIRLMHVDGGAIGWLLTPQSDVTKISHKALPSKGR